MHGRQLVIAESSQQAPADFDAIYQAHWWSMLRLAIGLVRDTAIAEEIVQDAFAAVYARWETLREPAAAVGYVRTCVVNGSRTALRRTGRARRHLGAMHERDVAGADEPALLDAEHALVRRALAVLPDRQREVLTLRYLHDLPDTEIATATGLSVGGVRSSASRGLAALRIAMGELQ